MISEQLERENIVRRLQGKEPIVEVCRISSIVARNNFYKTKGMVNIQVLVTFKMSDLYYQCVKSLVNSVNQEAWILDMKFKYVNSFIYGEYLEYDESFTFDDAIVQWDKIVDNLARFNNKINKYIQSNRIYARGGYAKSI
jgi:hypothetical protein